MFPEFIVKYVKLTFYDDQTRYKVHLKLFKPIFKNLELIHQKRFSK
jgi:hypothetical protein